MRKLNAMLTPLISLIFLDLGNGDAVHIGNFDRNDVFNSASISSFAFADGSTRWRIPAANDANHAMQIEWRAAA